MKRIFLLVLMALVCVGTQAQSYKKLLRQVLELQGKEEIITPEQKLEMASACGMVLENSGIEDPAMLRQAKALMAEYFKNHLEDDVLDVLAESFQKEVSKNELKEYVRLASVPKTKEVLQRVSKVTNDQQALSAGILDMMSSGKEVSYTCDEEYQKSFNLWLDESDTKSMLNALGEQLAALMQNADEDEAKREKMAALMNRLFDALPVLMCNMLYKDGVTVEELAVVREFYQQPCAKKMSKGGMVAFQSILSNPEEFGNKIMKKAMEWVMEHFRE